MSRKLTTRYDLKLWLHQQEANAEYAMRPRDPDGYLLEYRPEEPDDRVLDEMLRRLDAGEDPVALYHEVCRRCPYVPNKNTRDVSPTVVVFEGFLQDRGVDLPGYAPAAEQKAFLDLAMQGAKQGLRAYEKVKKTLPATATKEEIDRAWRLAMEEELDRAGVVWPKKGGAA